MKTKPFNLAIAAAVTVLSGCTDSTYIDDLVNTHQSDRLATHEMNRDKQIIADTIERLNKEDPSIIDAYFKLDDKGEKTIVVARWDGDGLVSTWEAPAEGMSAAMDSVQDNETAQDPSWGGDGSSSLITGLLAGYVISNMLSSGASATMSPQQYSERKINAGSAYSASVLSSARNSVRRAGLGRQSSLGRSSGGSFSSTGARAGGYSSGG